MSIAGAWWGARHIVAGNSRAARGPRERAPAPTLLSEEQRAPGAAATSGGQCLVLPAGQARRGIPAVQASAPPALGCDARPGRLAEPRDEGGLWGRGRQDVALRPGVASVRAPGRVPRDPRRCSADDLPHAHRRHDQMPTWPPMGDRQPLEELGHQCYSVPLRAP